MKVALVYDRVNKWGGAERVLLTLHEMFPDAPLYTSVYNPRGAPWAKIFPKVIPSFLQKIPFATDRHEHFPYLMPLAFESFNFDGYDLVISVTSEAAKGIITKPGTLHICYCLTPTRYLWSHYDEYFKGASFKGVTKPVVEYLRKWDVIAAQRPDVMVVISTEVKDRIKRYYDRESEVIYPPIDVKKFEIRNAKSETNSKFQIQNPKLKDYFLVVSRLVPYKRVDLAIDAFVELGLPLVVVGTGSEERKFRAKYKSKSNFIFKGFVSEDELVSLYRKATAFIIPQEEDFGITAVEAQAAGCPVIAYKKGGALETVIDGRTGVFFDKQSRKDLINAIERFDKIRFDKINLLENARRFSKERFKREFTKLVEKCMSSHLQ